MMKIHAVFQERKKQALINGRLQNVVICLVIVDVDGQRRLGFGYAMDDHKGKICYEDRVPVIRLLRAWTILTHFDRLSPGALDACWEISGTGALSAPSQAIFEEELAGTACSLVSLRRQVMKYRPDAQQIDDVLGRSKHHRVELDTRELLGHRQSGVCPPTALVDEFLRTDSVDVPR